MAINTRGIINLLNPEKEKGKYCSNCNLHYMRSTKQRCEKCPFVFNSSYINGASRVAPGSRFREFNIPNVEKLGKHHIFYFLYHSELKFEFPPIPEINMFGVESTETTTWIIHHINGRSWDDSVWNLLLALNNEHNFFENLTVKENKFFRQLNEQHYNV